MEYLKIENTYICLSYRHIHRHIHIKDKMPSPDFYGTDRVLQDDFTGYLRREMYLMYHAITRLELWNELSKYTPDPEKGFIWSDDPLIKKITDTQEIKASGHTGASLAMCFRTMEYIAKNGWDEFKKN
jgi:hypothetical protein